MGLNRELLGILACPRCHGDLEILPEGVEQRETGPDIEGCQGLACNVCECVYPVIDEIPVMLIEEAVPRVAWNEGQRSKS